METMTIEQEVAELIEALKSQEGQTLIQFLDATSPRLQEIHQDLQSLNASLSVTFLKLEDGARRSCQN
jgi:hypothetical protein